MWEYIQSQSDYDGADQDEESQYLTDRLKVPGGWIVRTIVKASIPKEGLSVATSTIFISDPRHTWVLEKEKESDRVRGRK